MRMSVPQLNGGAFAYTGVIFPRKKKPCTHHQVGRAGGSSGAWTTTRLETKRRAYSTVLDWY
jgi:hypothetical protein